MDVICAHCYESFFYDNNGDPVEGGENIKCPQCGGMNEVEVDIVYNLREI